MLVDVRTDLQFDDVHIRGSICIPSFSSGFGSKLAWLADHDQEIIFIGRDDADGRRAAGLALAVGVRNIAGLLAGGMTNWRQERQPVAETERLSVADFAERLPRRSKAAGARRARAQRVGRGPHPGLLVHALARHRRTSPMASTQRARSPSSARPACARPRPPACCSGSAPSMYSTWSTAACRRGLGSVTSSSACPLMRWHCRASRHLAAGRHPARNTVTHSEFLSIHSKSQGEW